MIFSRPLLAVSLAVVAATATGYAQQIPQPTVIPTANWPVSVSTGDAQPHNGVADLLYCDPGVAGVSTGCHLLHGVGNGTFTPGEDYTAFPDTGGFYSAAFFNFGNTTHQVVTLSTVNAQPKTMNLLIQFGMGASEGNKFPTNGPLDPIPGPIQYILYDNNSPTPQFNTNRGFITEDVANGTLYSMPVDGSPLITSIPNVGPGGFITGDFDGDAKTDILAPSTTNGVTFYHGNGNGTFTAGTSYTLTGGIFSMLVQDIDSDGIPDLVVEGANGALSYFPGTTTGFSATAHPLTGAQDGTTGNGGHLIAIADLNGDGVLDIITSTPAGISVLLGQSGLSYKLGGIYNAGPGRSSYGLVDLNGDGYLDLVVDSPRGIAILFGNEDGSFQTSRSYAAGAPAYSLALGQFTGSGNLDAILATGTPQVQLLNGDGNGGFSLQSPASPVGAPQTNSARTLWSSVVTGDFDGDSKLDAAVTPAGALASSPGPLSLLFGDGTGSFAPPVALVMPVFPAAGSSATGDFNGDGPSDIVNSQSLACDTYTGGNASRSGTMPPYVLNSSSTPVAYSLVATGFLKANHTAKQDIVCDRAGTILVYKNNGDGTFTKTATIDPPSIGIVSANASGVLPATGYFPSALLLADLDGDGNGDVIVVYHNLASDPAHYVGGALGNLIYVYWGVGDGTYTPLSSIDMAPDINGYMATVASIDGDGIPDLIISDGYLVEVLREFNRNLGSERVLLAGMGINGIATITINGQTAIVAANGGAVFSNPAVNRGTLASNAEVDTGGITVLLQPLVGVTGTLTANPVNPGYGRTFTLTATLTPSNPAPTGTVNFSIDGTFVGTETLASGIATFNVTAPAYSVGSHTLTAVYSGDATYSTLTLTGTLNVTLLPSQTSMTNIVSRIFYGQIIGDIAVGTEGPLVPTDTASLVGGNISFSIDGATVCSLPVNGSPQTCPVSTGASYSAGSYTLRSMYSGNQFYSSSVSPKYPVQVLPDDTQGTLTSSLNPATLGQPVKFTAVFTGSFATPVGTVTFFDGATSLGMGTLDATGTATLTTANLALGTHSITASYAATTNFNASTTTAVSQVINPAPLATVTTLISSANPSMLGQTVTFTATVAPSTPSASTPAGTVIFMLDGSTLNPVSLSAQGTASFSAGTLTLGSHTVVATYSGASTGTAFGSSTSAQLTQIVNVAGNFTMTITPTPISVPIGNTASVLITLTRLNGFNQPIELSCSGLPREATCAFDTTIISASGGSTHLSISAMAPHDCGTTSPYFITPSGSTTWLGLLTSSGLLLLLRRRRRLVKGIILALALCILPALSGCGNCTDLGVEPGNYSFTVTATSTGSPSATASQTIKMVAHL